MNKYPTTEPVTINITGSTFSGVVTGHVTRNIQTPRFNPQTSAFTNGDTVAMTTSGSHMIQNKWLDVGDVGTIDHLGPTAGFAIVKFWAHPDALLDIPVEYLVRVKP